MALILSIDNSTRGCSVALHQNGTLLANYDLLADKSSSAMLTTLLQNAVEHAGYALTALDAVAVAKGPGSYTGLRIAVSTAKGLCFALDKPLIGIDTLTALTTQICHFYPSDTLFCPLLDARRMEVYCAVLTQSLHYVQSTTAKIMDENAFADLLANQKIVFFGDGAAKCQPLLAHQPNAIFPTALVQPSAYTVGLLAHKAFENQQFENLVTFEPYYLKEFMGSTPRKNIF